MYWGTTTPAGEGDKCLRFDYIVDTTLATAS